MVWWSRPDQGGGGGLWELEILLPFRGISFQSPELWYHGVEFHRENIRSKDSPSSQITAREMQGSLTDSELGLRGAVASCMILLARTFQARVEGRALECGRGVFCEETNPSPRRLMVRVKSIPCKRLRGLFVFILNGSFTSCYKCLCSPSLRGPQDPKDSCK